MQRQLHERARCGKERLGEGRGTEVERGESAAATRCKKERREEELWPAKERGQEADEGEF